MLCVKRYKPKEDSELLSGDEFTLMKVRYYVHLILVLSSFLAAAGIWFFIGEVPLAGIVVFSVVAAAFGARLLYVAAHMVYYLHADAAAQDDINRINELIFPNKEK